MFAASGPASTASLLMRTSLAIPVGPVSPAAVSSRVRATQHPRARGILDARVGPTSDHSDDDRDDRDGGPGDRLRAVRPGRWPAGGPHPRLAGCRVYTPYLRGFGPTRFRRQETMRSGQIGALGRDLCDLLEGLDLRDVVLAGHDWGARASYVASVLVPERVRGLVALSVGYGSTSLDAPISFEQARAYWYQWFFATPKGRRTLEHDRPALCRHLWRLWAPSWKFTSEAFDETASAWDNPDWLAVTVHSYTHRWVNTPANT